MTAMSWARLISLRVPGAMRHSSCRFAEPGPGFFGPQRPWTPGLQRTAPQGRSQCSGRAKRGPECAALRGTPYCTLSATKRNSPSAFDTSSRTDFLPSFFN